MRRRFTGGHDSAILFPAPRGGYIDVEKFRYREWAPALRAADLPHHRIYDMRHTTATWLLDGGEQMANVAQMLGTSVAQIEDTYNRPQEEVFERMTERRDRYGAS